MSRVPISANELCKDDVVNIVHDRITVDSLSTHGGGIYDDAGIFYPIRPSTKIYLVKRAPVYPPNYPPKIGDVWQNNTGRLYFITADRVHTNGGYGHSLHDIQEAMANPNAGYHLLFRK